MSLDIIRQITINDILLALKECEKLKRTSITRSSGKRVFGDYGKRVMYTCVGVHVSRNSPGVLGCNAFMSNLAKEHWTVLMKLMQHAEYCFEALADHQVISHMYHANQVLPFKMMNGILYSQESQLKYYSELAFGCYVFL